MKALLALSALLCLSTCFAEVVTKKVSYVSDGVKLEGFLAYDNSLKGNRPAVAIVHDWDGITDYEQSRAKQLAAMGYVAFAIDVYGIDSRPKTMEDNRTQATKYRSDVPLFRKRVIAGVDELKKQAFVDVKKIAAIGYCFGGGAVLELARSGYELQGVVSFHGSYSTPNTADAANIKTKILICHAIDDPAAPFDTVVKFMEEMRVAKVDYQFLSFNENVHPFTVPGPSYRPLADKRSWAAMKSFFSEIFG